MSSSEDSGANNSRDGSENGELGSQDISLVREELERLQVGLILHFSGTRFHTFLVTSLTDITSEKRARTTLDETFPIFGN